MSTFDPYADSPFNIITEGQEITIKFERTGPNTGRVSWNIPAPSNGCGADQQAYNGMVVTLDTSHVSPLKNPVSGTAYTADPTADVNLHAGDKIDTAMVVGAFYDDKETIYFDITGLQPNTPYYISGYAVDAQHRYHTEGVHAYSLDYVSTTATPSSSGFQFVQLSTVGVQGTDATSLLPATIYDFLLALDGNDQIPAIEIDGTDALTYDDLIDALTTEFKKIGNPQQSATVPNAGTYFWDEATASLFQWDGYTHNPLDSIVELTDPTIRAVGDFWYNPITDILNRWDIPAVIGWNATNVIKYHKDPTDLSCADYWFNTTNAYNWDGNVWCEKILHNQTTDPSLPITPDCGAYWYNEVDALLNKWNPATSLWENEDVIYWDVDPNTPAMNSFWFNDVDGELFEWTGSWGLTPATVSATEPTAPVANMYWFDTSTEVLQQRDGGNTVWNIIPVLIWESDPTVRTSCGTWWNSTNDNLYVWDITTSLWDLVPSFTQSEIDPTTPPTLSTDDVWYNPTNETLSRWDGGAWVEVTFIDFATDPTLPAVNDTWFNTDTSVWSVWTGTWTTFDPIESENDPESVSIPAGTYWFNLTTNGLNQWNGAAWVPLLHTTIPLTPAIGELWFETGSNILYEWDGTTWSIATPVVTVELNSDGHLLFTSSSTGSTSSIDLTDGILFNSLDPTGLILDGESGEDGVSDTPSYMDIGIGDDGTPDERRELMYSIRTQLGYPIVNVELTKYQLDTAVTGGLEELRKRSSNAYRRGYFFLDVKQGQQSYLLSNKTVGFNKIVNVMGIYRVTSAFMSGAYGGGVYGQMALQHLYTMGTFDLLSYHLLSSYIEELETLMGARIMYQWNEHTRKLDIVQTFYTDERVLIDATLERSEQELLTDRYTKTWIEQWALSEARLTLAEIRGKHATLPGAGGGVSLNAGELAARADADKLDLIAQLDDFVVSSVEDYGMGGTFVIG